MENNTKNKYKGKPKTDNEKWTYEESLRTILLTELQLGKCLINKTNGIVYLDSNEKQVKINIGKTRNGKDFSFSHPTYWRICTWWECFKIKTRLYKFWKVSY